MHVAPNTWYWYSHYKYYYVCSLNELHLVPKYHFLNICIKQWNETTYLSVSMILKLTKISSSDISAQLALMESSVFTERAPAGRAQGVCMRTFGRKHVRVELKVARPGEMHTCFCPANSRTELARIKYAKACLQRDKRGEQIALCLPTSTARVRLRTDPYILVATSCTAALFLFL